MNEIISNLDISLHAPENVIVQQGSDECDYMYFVQRGECQVIVHDKVGLDSGVKKVRYLYPGDHFGVRLLFT